jgi:phosphatidylserine synthase
VAFGVAPAALCWFRLKDHSAFAGSMQWVLIGAAGLYVVAVSGRLARFNISDPPGGDRYFFGIPTTLVGALLGSFYLVWESQGWSEAALLAFPLYLVVGSALMVSSIRLPKLKPRASLAINLFQFANVGLAYVIAPLRLWPEILLGQAVFYLVVGVGYCLVRPPRLEAIDLDAGAATGDHPDLKPAG